jgi:Meiotically up-regulated gene 113
VIYFVQSVVGGPIKIGCAVKIDRRIKELELYYGRKLILLATMEGDRSTEKEIHERFKHLRLESGRSRGVKVEQFRPSPDLMEFIGKPFHGGSDDVCKMSAVNGVTTFNLQGTKAERDHLDKISHETMIPKSRIVRAGINLWLVQNGRSPLPVVEGYE